MTKKGENEEKGRGREEKKETEGGELNVLIIVLIESIQNE